MSRTSVLRALLLLSLALAAGCRSTTPSSTRGAPASVTVVQGAPIAEAPDLTKPFDMSQMTGTDPLAIARIVARSAGGSWIAIAPKPLDDLSAQELYNRRGSQTVADVLAKLSGDGSKLAWDVIGKDKPESAYGLLYFGSHKELEALEKEKPRETVGLLIHAPSGPEMVRVIGDFWAQQIQADPALLTQRTALAQARAKETGATSSRGMYAAMMGGGQDEEEEAGDVKPALDLKIVERVGVGEIVKRLGGYFGGECREATPGRWELTRISDAAKVGAEIERLKKAIQDDPSTDPASGSSYAARMAGGDEDDGTAQLPPLRDEAQQAFDGLAMLGKPAIPALTGLLVPEKASLAHGAIQTLTTLHLPEARTSLVEFARKLKSAPLLSPAKPAGGAPTFPMPNVRQETPSSTAGNLGQRPSPPPAAPGAISRGMRDLLMREVIVALAKDAAADTDALLAEAAVGEEWPESARQEARLALIGRGKIDAFARNTKREIEPGEQPFVLADPTASPLAANAGATGAAPGGASAGGPATVPLATANVLGGDTWGVFLSGRYGMADDIWVARMHDHTWVEFLFTGKQFGVRQYGGYMGRGQKLGNCRMTVKGDTIQLLPPNASAAAELEKLQKQMQNGFQGGPGKQPNPQEVQKLYQRYSQLQQQTNNALKKPITLSIAALRKDSDGDGIPDLVEQRLGLDHNRADTDGDGIPDGRDGSPLSGPVKGEKAGLMQQLFAALYGGDPSREPIFVVLDRADWQEFIGARGRVICITPADWKRRARELATFRALEFGGPPDAAESILVKDGVCLYNDSRSRAEVHFWQWNRAMPASNPSYAMMASMGQGNPPQDFTARFERQGGQWRLLAVKQWKYRTAAQTAARRMRKVMEESSRGFVD